MADAIASMVGFPAPNGRLDLELAVGDVVLLRGRNGSGKTSLLRSLAGLGAAVRPAEVQVAGQDPAVVPAQALPALVHLALQDPLDTLVGLTVAGEFHLRGRPLPGELADLSERDVATLSSGQARRVELAVATSGSAALLLLDEPADGLDQARRAGLLRLVAQQRLAGAIVAVDHTGLLDGIASRFVDLSAGTSTTAAPRIAAGPSIVVACPARTVRRADNDVALPALALPGGLHALRGPNATGKSTLLLRLAGLLEPEGVQVVGQPPRPGDNVRLLLPRANDLFTKQTVAQELAATDPTTAAAFVAPPLLARHPLSLSAGEAQRVALAKTLGQPALLYLLDEPEAHLDLDGRAVLWDWLARRCHEGSCIVVATHETDLLAQATSVMQLGGPA
jgi:energy-coupling factor transporter ATP-binding protein EcfA2